MLKSQSACARTGLYSTWSLKWHFFHSPINCAVWIKFYPLTLPSFVFHTTKHVPDLCISAKTLRASHPGAYEDVNASNLLAKPIRHDSRYSQLVNLTRELCCLLHFLSYCMPQYLIFVVQFDPQHLSIYFICVVPQKCHQKCQHFAQKAFHSKHCQCLRGKRPGQLRWNFCFN